MNLNQKNEKVKSVEDLPKDQQDIFIKMGKYLYSKDLDEFFCGELINKDEQKRGFLSKEHIKESIKRIGIPISEN